MKPTKIVWMSRHAPTPSQLLALERHYPVHDLHFDPAPFSGAEDIIGRFHAIGADEMVVVAPWTVIRAITNRGLRILYAEMEQVPCYRSHEVTMGSRKKPRCYNFLKFHYCSGVKLELSEVPVPQTPTALTAPFDKGA